MIKKGCTWTVKASSHCVKSRPMNEPNVANAADALQPNESGQNPRSFRFSGHGTFACRYTWLPKIVRQLFLNPNLFEDDDFAMVTLGVGKNMVRSMRFWAETMGVAEQVRSRTSEMKVTEFGRAILSPEKGYDEFFEDDQTLWLAHWNLSTQVEPLFAWHGMINFWNKADFTRSEALSFFEKEAQREQRELSPVTLQEHLSIFLHTYVPTKSSKRELVEESLDCPLIELEFIQEVGERPMSETGRREKIYAFRTGEKREITAELFVYCLHDFWMKWHPKEKTMSFSQIALGECSPGQVFKMPEQEIRERLDSIARDSNGLYSYQENSAIQQVVLKGNASPDVLLRKVYRQK